MGILDNMCFGPSDGIDEDPVRGATICRRLGVSEELVQLLEEEAGLRESPGMGDTPGGTRRASHFDMDVRERAREMTANNGELMSQTDKCLLNLARALVMNPEVLVVHKPLVPLEPAAQRPVLNLMREFVDLRGIEKPPEGRRARRPRTCIFSTAASEGTEVADTVLMIQSCTIAEVDVRELHELRKQCHHAFHLMDTDGDRRVTLEEFVTVVPEIPWLMGILGVTEEMAKAPKADLRRILAVLFDALDSDRDRSLQLSEIVHYLHHRHSESRLNMLRLPDSTDDDEATGVLGLIDADVDYKGTSPLQDRYGEATAEEKE